LVDAALDLLGVALLDRLLRSFAAARIDVADCQHLNLLLPQEIAQVAAVHRAHADEADAEPLPGGILLVVAQGRTADDERQSGSGGCFDEASTCDRVLAHDETSAGE